MRLRDLGCGDGFLDAVPKAPTLKDKRTHQTLSKLKTFVYHRYDQESKKNLEQGRQNVSRTPPPPLQKGQTTQFKNGRRTSKKTYQRPTGSQKGSQAPESVGRRKSSPDKTPVGARSVPGWLGRRRQNRKNRNRTRAKVRRKRRLRPVLKGRNSGPSLCKRCGRSAKS